MQAHPLRPGQRRLLVAAAIGAASLAIVAFLPGRASAAASATGAAGSFSAYGTADAQAVTVPAAANRVLVFVFAGKSGGDTLGSVTYGGAPLTLLAAHDEHSVHLEVRYLVAPPVGTQQLAWTKTGAKQNVTWGYTVYAGVDQTTPFTTPAAAGATGATGDLKRVTLETVPGDLVLDAFALNGGAVVGGNPAGLAPQTTRWAAHVSTTEGGSSDAIATDRITTMNWTPSPGAGGTLDWALIATRVRPAGSSTGLTPTLVTTPGAAQVQPGTPVTATATVSGPSGAAAAPTGTVTFFLCPPATVAANGGTCSQGGTQVGAAKALAPAGASSASATSDAGSTAAAGAYCWRAVYSGDGLYAGLASAGSDCFAVASPPAGGVTLLASGGRATYGTSDAQSVTVPSGPNRLLVLVFAGRPASAGVAAFYGGQPLQRLTATDQRSAHLDILYLVDPPSGTQQLTTFFGQSPQNATWGYSVYSGVDQTHPFGTPSAAGGVNDAGGVKSTPVPAGPGDLVLDGFVVNGGTVVGGDASPGAGQTRRWAAHISTTEGGSSDQPATGTVTSAWAPAAGAGSGLDWALVAVPVHPAGGGPVNLSPPTVQGPVPASAVSNSLTASPGTWSGTGTITFSYRWQLCRENGVCGDVSPVTGSVLTGVAPTTYSSFYTVVVTATDANGSTSASPPAPTGWFELRPPLTNTQLPAVTGTPMQGATLDATLGNWVGLGRQDAGGAQGWQLTWQRCEITGTSCTDIPGTTVTRTSAFVPASSYTATSADLGYALRVRVDATDDAGNQLEAASAPTGVVQFANLAPDPDLERNPGPDYYTDGVAGFAWAGDRAHSGTHSLQIDSTSSGLTRWMTRISAIPVTPGRVYDVVALVQTLNATDAYLAASYWTAGQSYAGATDSSGTHLSGTSGGWTQLALRTTAPPGAAYLRVESRLSGPGTTWTDDIAVVARS